MNTIVYVRPDNQAKIVCDCGLTKTLDMSQYGRRITEAKIKCKCGNTCTITFEYRQQYRKTVNLFGLVMLPNKKRYDVQISNVSMSGIHFEIIGDENVLIINDRSNINIGDYARISFRLDDTHKSKIDRMIVIRRIQDKDIGAEFCDNIADKKLGFYLMP